MSLLRWLGLASAVAASGCASAPSRYYTLVPESGVHPDGAIPLFYRVEVKPVKMPAQVDRLEIVTRLSDGSLLIADNQRWIVPVADELQSALSIELTRELGEGNAGINQAGFVEVSLRMEVERFESALSRYALIESTWHVDLRTEHRDVQIACHTRAYEHVSGGYLELVRGYQRAVDDIAREIAGVARQSATSPAAPACPLNPGRDAR